MALGRFNNIILLNNYTLISKDAILNLVTTGLRLGEISIYGGRIYYYSNPERLLYDGGEFHEWSSKSKHFNMKKIKTEIENNQDIKEVNLITFYFVFRFILEKIGLLDEPYFIYVVDLDYSYRVQKSGFKLYHVVNSEIWHKVSACSEEQINKFLAYWYYRNSLKIRIKHKKGFKKIVSILSKIGSRFLFIVK